MKVKFYDEMELKVFDKTPIAQHIFKTACDITMKQTEDQSGQEISQKLVHQILEGDHTSVFEHASITFLVTGISRSLLAQLTRQRHFSFTSASQHYQSYENYPVVLNGQQYKEGTAVQRLFEQSLKYSLLKYKELRELGVPPEEARQVLPNASAVSLLITANPRALITFLRTRLCKRNIKEMQIFADKLHTICKHWIPEIFEVIDRPCIEYDRCNQGKLSCKNS